MRVKQAAPFSLAVAVCLAVGFATEEEKPGGKATAELTGARARIDAADYKTIQAAIDALPPEGGIVTLPPGVFEISKPILIAKQDVLLEGAGTATHIKNTNGAGQPAILIQPEEWEKNKRARLWRIELAQLRITGNDKSGPGILANAVNELFLHDLTISYNGGDGIRMIECYEDPRISDCLITYNKAAGLYIKAGHDIVVSANQFEENVDAVYCTDSFNLCMSGNNLDDHLRHGVVIENTYGSIVSANMIEECKGTAIVLDRDCYGITLAANVIAHEEGGGIELLDAHGCAVSANTFTIVKQSALYIGPKSGRITVTGNNFSNSFIGDGKVKRGTEDLFAAGIVLEATRQIVISGNVFSGLTTKAVELKGTPSKQIIFANNLLVGVESDHEKIPGLVGASNLNVQE
jgi:parallel beta-helix repeat protein